MTVESERGSSDSGVDAESTPTPRDAPSTSVNGSDLGGQYSSEQIDAQGGESPELLRTRADSLLDEMMLGAVDVSAAGYTSSDHATSDYTTSDQASSDSGFHDDAADVAADTYSYTSTSSNYTSSDNYSSSDHVPDFDADPDPVASDSDDYAFTDAPDGNGRYDFDFGDYGSAGSWTMDSAQNGASSPDASSSDPSSFDASSFGPSSSHASPSYAPSSNAAAGNGYDRSPAQNGAHASPDPDNVESNGHGDDAYPRTDHSAYSPASADSSSAYSTSDASEYAGTVGDGSGADAQRQNGYTTDEENAPTPTPEWRVKTGGGAAADNGTWNEYVTSFRSPAATASEPTGQIQKWQPTSPADGYSATATGSATSSDSEAGVGEIASPSSSAATNSAPHAASHADTQSAASPQGAGDGSHESLGYVSAMSVMPKGPRRSSLLPRMSRFDVDALNREIAELHEEIRTLLPIGHDQAERAQHLLDKAHTIAGSDPERSAEVEYYMQQVRTIVERTRQSRRWSDLYRDRLRTYLLAWALLATMTLTALLLSQFQIEALVAGFLDAARDGAFMRNFAGGLGAMMAGALGGALGALINMGKHARSQYGFFDRKYGLRGLILPIIGALVGLVIYALFAVVYQFAGINPSMSAAAMATPALLALVFGFSQESIYGTSG